MATRFNQLLRARGIMKGETKYYVSLAHTRADIDHTIAAWTGSPSRSSRCCDGPNVAVNPHRPRRAVGLRTWYAWLGCGLIGDGSYYLLDAVAVGPYKGRRSGRARRAQSARPAAACGRHRRRGDGPALAGAWQSLGWFALPAVLYSLAILLRTRHDPLQQASIVIAIAIVFMTSSFLIVAEHVTACAIATMAAAWIVRPGTRRRATASSCSCWPCCRPSATRCSSFSALCWRRWRFKAIRHARSPFLRDGDVSRGRAALPGLDAVLAWRTITTFEDKRAYFASASSEACEFPEESRPSISPPSQPPRRCRRGPGSADRARDQMALACHHSGLAGDAAAAAAGPDPWYFGPPFAYSPEHHAVRRRPRSGGDHPLHVGPRIRVAPQPTDRRGGCLPSLGLLFLATAAVERDAGSAVCGCPTWMT